MKWLVGLNVAAALVYATFVVSFLVADIWVFPRTEVLSGPPPAVAAAIEQGHDPEGMREMALLLFDHITHQTTAVNDLIASTVFWGRVHFLLALGIACLNIVLLLHLRRSPRQTNGDK